MTTITLNGSSVGNQIENFLADLKPKYDTANKGLKAAEESYQNMVSISNDIIQNLAKTYLPELNSDDIAATPKEIHASLKLIFQQQQDKRAELTALMEESQSRRDSCQNEIKNLAALLTDAVARRDKLSVQAIGILKQDSSYNALTSEANLLLPFFERDEAILEEITADFGRKVKAIEKLRFFRYLLNRDYDPKNPRFLDGWIAQRVASESDEHGNRKYKTFSEVKTYYDYLKRMPELMKKDLEERLSRKADLEKKINTAEEAVAVDIGLAPIFDEIKALIEKRKSLSEKIDEEIQIYEGYAKEKEDVDKKDNQYLEKAYGKLIEYLNNKSVADLKAMARNTPGSEDDMLVDKLEGLKAKLEGLNDKRDEASELAKGLSYAYKGLAKILNDFSKGNFDSSRSYFTSGFDLDPYLTGLVEGKFTVEQVWSYIKTHRKLKPAEYFSDYHGDSYGGRKKGYSDDDSDDDRPRRTYVPPPVTHHHSTPSSSDSWSTGSGIGSGGWSGSAHIGGKGW